MNKHFSSVPTGRTARAVTRLWGVLVAVVVAALLGGFAPAANAVTTGTSTLPVSVAGSSTTTKVPLATAAAAGNGFVFTVAALDVQPSTLSSEAQRAHVQYQLQSWDARTYRWKDLTSTQADVRLGTWVQVQDPNPNAGWDEGEESYAWVGAGQRVPAMRFGGTWSSAVGGEMSFRVIVTVTWVVENTGGQVLGTTMLTPVVAGDLACPKLATSCSVRTTGVFALFVLKR
jgi:hypothetical protein